MDRIDLPAISLSYLLGDYTVPALARVSISSLKLVMSARGRTDFLARSALPTPVSSLQWSLYYAHHFRRVVLYY